jgi:hypothetical protein
MGGPTSSYATAGIALRGSGALNPHHHDKVQIPSVGEDWFRHSKIDKRDTQTHRQPGDRISIISFFFSK